MDDLNTFFEIFSNVTVNTYLPMFPLKTLDEARTLLKDKYLDMEYRYTVCLKENNIPIGYVSIIDYDLGYGLLAEYWNKGIITESCRKVIDTVQDTLPFLTATHPC